LTDIEIKEDTLFAAVPYIARDVLQWVDTCDLRLPPIPDFVECPGFAPWCPTSRQDHLPWDAKCPGFQGVVKMTTVIIITIVIIGVIVLI